MVSPGRARPERTCVGCRTRGAKSDLLRLVWSGSELVVDVAQHHPGRGAYLHRNADCLSKAVRRRALGRALRTDQLATAEVQRVVTAFLDAVDGPSAPPEAHPVERRG